MGNSLTNGIRKVFRVEKTTETLTHNDSDESDVEMNNAIEENEMQTSEPTDEVQAYGRYLSKETYDLIKNKKSASWWRERGNVILQQKSPIGNTVLHIAALYGNDKFVDEVVEHASKLLSPENASELLDAKNEKGDTALHVAARAGHMSTLHKLLAASLPNLPDPYSEKGKEALDKFLVKNKQGNTFFHEALLNGHKCVMGILFFLEKQIEAGFMELVQREVLISTNNEEISVLNLAIVKGFEDSQEVDKMILPQWDQGVRAAQKELETEVVDQSPLFLTKVVKESALTDMIMHRDRTKYRELGQLISGSSGNNLQVKSPLSMAILKQDQEMEVDIVEDQFNCTDMIMDRDRTNYRKQGQLIAGSSGNHLQVKSPLIMAILKQDQDISQIISMKKKEWIHLKDNKGRTALHYAASVGYLKDVEYLLGNSISTNMERDNDGFFPLHLASAGGHTKVVNKLLEQCPDPREILDNRGRNIVHIAAQMGKFNVIRYILQDVNHRLVDMINDKDTDGNTPLHLATLHCHPKVVHALTRDKRVDLTLVNTKNQTALDACIQIPQKNPPLRQRLTWIALKSAGAQYAKRESNLIEVPLSEEGSFYQKKSEEGSNMDPYKDRINTLMVVSTLITTVAFAAGFTLPGGTNSSESGQGHGMALMLNHVWFKPFIFCIAISMYGGISVTIILIWAQLGDITLALFALQVARPLLGVTLATLSVAFLSGVHLVISDLSWLVTAFLVLCVISIFMLLLLYTLLWLPSSSSNIVIRGISHYPFQFLTWLVEQDETEGM